MTNQARPSLDALLGRQARLPAVPAVLAQLLEEVGQPGSHSSRVASLVASDPVLAARTLRMANSSYFHRSHKIDTIGHAVQLLGLSMIRSLALAASLQDAFAGLRGFDLKAFWTHSVRTAAAARWLARHGRVDPEQATLVGLLHGIGLLQMHASMREHLVEIDRTCPPLHTHRAQAECEAFGYDHTDVAARLLQAWRFPSHLAAALRSVPRPNPGTACHALALVVGAAAEISRGHVTGLELGGSPDTGLSDTRLDEAGQIAVLSARGQWLPLPGFDELCASFGALLA